MKAQLGKADLPYTTDAVRFLDRVRALSMKMPGTSSRGFVVSLREALGFMQKELGERAAKSRAPNARRSSTRRRSSLAALERLRREAVRRGVEIPQ